jgi:hypothetical protein
MPGAEPSTTARYEKSIQTGARHPSLRREPGEGIRDDAPIVTGIFRNISAIL